MTEGKDIKTVAEEIKGGCDAIVVDHLGPNLLRVRIDSEVDSDELERLKEIVQKKRCKLNVRLSQHTLIRLRPPSDPHK